MSEIEKNVEPDQQHLEHEIQEISANPTQASESDQIFTPKSQLTAQRSCISNNNEESSNNKFTKTTQWWTLKAREAAVHIQRSVLELCECLEITQQERCGNLLGQQKAQQQQKQRKHLFRILNEYLSIITDAPLLNQNGEKLRASIPEVIISQQSDMHCNDKLQDLQCTALRLLVDDLRVVTHQNEILWRRLHEAEHRKQGPVDPNRREEAYKPDRSSEELKQRIRELETFNKQLREQNLKLSSGAYEMQKENWVLLGKLHDSEVKMKALISKMSLYRYQAEKRTAFPSTYSRTRNPISPLHSAHQHHQQHHQREILQSLLTPTDATNFFPPLPYDSSVSPLSPYAHQMNIPHSRMTTSIKPRRSISACPGRSRRGGLPSQTESSLRASTARSIDTQNKDADDGEGMNKDHQDSKETSEETEATSKQHQNEELRPQPTNAAPTQTPPLGKHPSKVNMVIIEPPSVHHKRGGSSRIVSIHTSEGVSPNGNNNESYPRTESPVASFPRRLSQDNDAQLKEYMSRCRRGSISVTTTKHPAAGPCRFSNTSPHHMPMQNN